MSDLIPESDGEDGPIRFDANGLVPVVIQEADTHAVLMVGFMNAAALAATRETGRVHFWSRSRGKLWRKGETSGHEQIVEDIFVNCERNSLLILVHQVGAVCHDGYRTCYYRRLDEDDSLTIIQERAFDPANVYGVRTANSLVQSSQLHYEAYAFLRDNDLASVSGTSARLSAMEDTTRGRLADELVELAGALDGSHRHAGFAEDVLLESTQVLYWTTLVALRAGVTWGELRPDRALSTVVDGVSPAVIAHMLRAEADTWRMNALETDPVSARCHAVLALAGQACQSAGHVPSAPVEADLSDLRTRPYLDDYFASREGSQAQRT